MKRTIVWTCFLCQLFFAATVFAAEPDFFGIKMRSVRCAEDFKIEKKEAKKFIYSYNKETMSDKIRASAVFFSYQGKVKEIYITVYNDSDKPIPAKRVFTTFAVVTNDGDTYEMDDPSHTIYPLTELIAPQGGRVRFVRWITRHDLGKKDIKMIVCSFDLGETKIVLVPNPFFRETGRHSKFDTMSLDWRLEGFVASKTEVYPKKRVPPGRPKTVSGDKSVSAGSSNFAMTNAEKKMRYGA